MRNNFEPMYDSAFRDSISGIVREGSKLKKELFKSVVMEKEFDPSVTRMYMGTVNDFLRFWDEYSKDLAIKIKGAKGSEGVRTAEYQFIKDYIYAKYDFASILPFADGIIKGLTDEKFVSVEDIEDFRDHTIAKAFDDLAPNVAGIVDRVTQPGLGQDFNHAATSLDAKMFDSIRSYNMFESRARSELYRAIDKTIEFISTDVKKRKFPSQKDMRLFVSMVNNIVEYISFSLTAYAARIYIIQAYAYPFIYAAKDDKVVPANMSESVILEKGKNHAHKEEEKDESKGTEKVSKKESDSSDHKSDSSEDIHRDDVNISSDPDGNIEITVMRDADDRLCKDVADIAKYFKYFDDFIKMAGAESLFKETRRPSYGDAYITQATMENNCFCKKLMSNPLHEFLFGGHYKVFPYSANGKQIEELYQVLKSFVYNNVQGVQGTASPKQEILHVIRGTEIGDTPAKYRELIKDLYLCALHFLTSCERVTMNITEWSNNEAINNRYSISARNNAIDCLQMISELYRDLATAFLQKARDVESKYNAANNAVISKLRDITTLKLPGAKSTEEEQSANISNTVPDTTRLPTDLMDLYALPAFESMELWDEYLRYLPEFTDSLYLNEAFNISSIINALISRIQASWKRIMNFFSDKRTQTAIKWVKEHRDKLLNMNLRGCQLQVINYKVDVSLPEGFDHLITNLQNIPENALEDANELEKWVQSLYPNDTVYKWFNGTEDEKKNGAMKYRNLLLFQDLNEVTDEDFRAKLVTIGDSQVAKNLSSWVDTISKADELYKQLEQLQRKLESAVNNLKAKTVGVANKAQNQVKNESFIFTEDGTTGTPGAGAGAGASGTGTPPDANQGQGNGNNSSQSQNSESKNPAVDLINQAITKAEVAITQLHGSLGPMIIEYILAEYKYLQQAYEYSKNNNG